MGAGVKNVVAAAFWGLVLGGVSPLVSAQQYTNDNVGRLTKVVFSNGARMAFTYDRAGNRLTETYGAPVAQVDKDFDAIAGVDVDADGAPQGEAAEEAAGAILAGADAVTDDTAQPGPRPADVSTAVAVPGRDATTATPAGRR